MAAQGFDLVKIYRLHREPCEALMDEARLREIAVAGHHPDVVHDGDYEAPLDLPMEAVLASGIVSLEHLDELITVALRMKLDPDAVVPLARELRGHGVAVTTLLVQDLLVQEIRRQGTAFLDDERREQVRRFFGDEGVATVKERIDFITHKLPKHIADLGAAIPDFSLSMLRTFHEAGVTLLIGTDSHSPLVIGGRSGLDEMDLFVRAGLRPYDALVAATRNGALVLGRSDSLGTVAVGKQADLLLLEDNPLEDLAALRRPVGVLSHGRFSDRDAIEELLEAAAAADPE